MGSAVGDYGEKMLFRLQPHVRYSWSQIGRGKVVDSEGDMLKGTGHNDSTIRVGSRAMVTFSFNSNEPLPAMNGVNLYAEANWVNYSHARLSTSLHRDSEHIRTDAIKLSNAGEIRLGLEGHLSRNLQLWGDLHHIRGNGNFKDSGFRLGLKKIF